MSICSAIGFQVDLARQMEKPDTLKEIIDFGGSVGYNELFLYGEGNLEYKTHPECSTAWALKQAEFIKLQDYAIATYSMQLIPVIPVLGHANYILKPSQNKHLREVQNQADTLINCNMQQFCPSNPESYRIIEELLAEWINITRAPVIHIGGDESWNFAVCPVCRKKAEKTGRGKLLAEYFNKINSIVKKHGKKTMIWHDMLFYYDDCIPHLDKDIIICDWHYKPIERHPGISIYNWRKTNFLETYKKENLSAYICPKSKCGYFEETNNIKTFIEYSEKYKVSGFLNTVWEMSWLPFASAYPSLAYGAAAATLPAPPVPEDFIENFALKHFSSGYELIPFFAELLEKTAELRIFGNLSSIINYQNPTTELNTAGKLKQAFLLCDRLKAKTKTGQAYQDALELIFKRNAITLQVKGLVNEIARAYLPQRNTNTENITKRLKELNENLQKIPNQILLEEKMWKRYRPEKQNNPVVKSFLEAQEYFSDFIIKMKGVISGKIKTDKALPFVLEVTLINNDCSWQSLSIFTANKKREYVKIGTYPQCNPFGRYIKTFSVTKQARVIKLELKGLGQIQVHYLRLIGPGMELKPAEIVSSKGLVFLPENILTDDFKPASLGDIDSRKYFSQGKEQPAAIVELRLEK